MIHNVFLDERKHPGDVDLRKKLGRSYRLFEEVLITLQFEQDAISFEWKFSKTAGWYLICLRKKRRLFYFIPKHRDFRFRMVFGEKAVAAIEKEKLPAKYVRSIRTAKRYSEGRLLELGNGDFSVDAVLKLLRIKIMN